LVPGLVDVVAAVAAEAFAVRSAATVGAVVDHVVADFAGARLDDTVAAVGSFLAVESASAGRLLVGDLDRIIAILLRRLEDLVATEVDGAIVEAHVVAAREAAIGVADFVPGADPVATER